jgi:hypothetical protein
MPLVTQVVVEAEAEALEQARPVVVKVALAS